LFTGMIEALGRIRSQKRLGKGLALEIECGFKDLQLGESIAVDGVCLTVTEKTLQGFWCELSPETLALTIAPSYAKDSRVNLERALTLGSRLGGHWVTGHVDTQAVLKEKEPFQEFWKMSFSGLPQNFQRFLIPKGSIAVNGVSLTVNQVTPSGFEVMLIPHTLEKTNLKELEKGNGANIGVDWMSKLIVQTTEQFLKGQA